MFPRHSLAVILAGAALAMTAGAARADTYVDPSTEYLNRIKVGQSIQPLGEAPFGESVSLYTGGISFRQTDISLPGIGPTITLTRTYEATGSPLTYGMDLALGDWGLATPEITTIVPGQRMGMTGGWEVETPERVASNARCSRFNIIASYQFAFGLAWRHGYQLLTGDGDSQAILARTPENTLAPGGNVAGYPIVTPRHWMLSCLPHTSNGMPGEAFLATAPDGTRYWLDHLAYGAPLETLIEAIPRIKTVSAPTEDSFTTGTVDQDEGSDVYWGLDEEYMPRRRGHLFATRVEDRFGNWVRYRYEGERLLEITASDGRHVVLAWRADAPVLDSITVQPGHADARTWRYEYQSLTVPESRRLVRVIQPDGTAWGLSMAYASIVKLGPVDAYSQCHVRSFTQIASDDNLRTVTITHPSGLVGSFELSRRAHARSWVPTECRERNGATSPPSEDLPSVYLSLSLTRKTFSGPGVEPMTWSYSYLPAYGSTRNECLATGCLEWSAVEVTDPSANTVRYVHSTKWGAAEGKLLGVVHGVTSPGTFAGGGLQTETTSFADPSLPWMFPSRIGDSLEDPIANSNTAPTEQLQPVVRHETQRQDVSFTRETLAFDRFGHPETVRRGSSLGYTVTETTQYWPVDGQWVLGLPWKVIRGTRVINQTDYDARMQPARVYNFGLLVGSYGYLGNGMLGSTTDPLGNTTVLSDHKRGVPQLIRFPDGSSVAPSVDDFGQISRVTNQLGDSTGYLYDPAGRMTRITYPANDSVAWNPVKRDFTRANSSEFGLPLGHWRQTIQTGDAIVSTYYDAYWRPRLTLTENALDPGSRSFVVRQFDDDGRETFAAYPVSDLATIDQPLTGVRTSYDALGRRVRVTQDSELGPLVTRIDYLSGFRTRTTNPRGHATTTSFQAFDSPTEDSPVRIEAPESVTTVIVRDEFGKPKSITRSGPGA